MKIKLAIIALVFCCISIVYDTYSFISKIILLVDSFTKIADAVHVMLLVPIAFMLPKIAVLCLSIAVLLPYKKTAETSSANTAARRVKN